MNLKEVAFLYEACLHLPLVHIDPIVHCMIALKLLQSDVEGRAVQSLALDLKDKDSDKGGYGDGGGDHSLFDSIY